MKKLLLFLYFFTGIGILTETFAQVPTISSFTPTTAKPGDVITLTGTNFNITVSNNIVFFGATKATVTGATATTITATVPTGATFAPITVLNTGTGLAAYSPANFAPIYAPAKTNITATAFLAKQDITLGINPNSVAIGDLDGDGKADLAVANNGSNTVSVYRNTSTTGEITASSFAAKVDFTTGDLPYSVAIGDLDGDGKPDLVVANSGTNNVSIFRNTGSVGNITAGSFAAKVDFTTGTTPQSVAIGDLDRDGKPDLAVTNFSSGNVSILRNLSSSGSITTGSFAAKVDFTTGANPTSVAIGDLDGDSKLDLAVTNGSTNVSVYRNTATSGSITSGSFATRVNFTTGTNPSSVAIGDLDQDGKLDLAVANFSSNSVSVLRNAGTGVGISTGSFAAKVDFTTGTNPNSVAIGDVDGDSKPDLAVANYNASSVSVLRNTATAGSIASDSFAAKVDFTTGSIPASVAIGDLDGDGKPDLTVANYSANSISLLRNADLSPIITSFSPVSAKPGDAITLTGTNFSPTASNNVVFFGATKAAVTAATATNLTVTVPTGATYGPIRVLNTAGNLAAYSQANFIPVYAPAKASINTTDFLPKEDFTAGSVPSFVAIGDLDGDGKPDLAVANNVSNTISVYRNTSTTGIIAPGSFAAKVDFTTGTRPNSIAIGDLDGDGRPDLATANALSNNVSVFRNMSSVGDITSGSFAAKVDFTTGDNPFSVAIGDLDGDGKLDLATANGTNSVSVLRNTSTSGSIASNSFETKVDFTTGTYPQSVAIGDLDGDGRPDLATANATSNNFSVLRNTATSGSISTTSFAAKVDYTTGTNPASIAIGDLDGDGRLDVTVANQASSTVSVYRNTATAGTITAGSFAAKVDFTIGTDTYPLSIAIGDLDGDGKPDLATANNNSSSISVLRNMASNGDITASSFAAKVDFTTASTPYSVAIGDLDGDSKPDLVTANRLPGNISVLRNTDGTLPVVLRKFEAKLQKDGAVLLSWDTYTEQNNAYFEVSRSTDGSNFTVLGTVKGSDTRNQISFYSFTDRLPLTGENYYKLVQVDSDGTRKELGVKSIQVTLSREEEMAVFPNPASDVLSVRFKAGIYHKVYLLDLSGKILSGKTIGAEEDDIKFDVRDLPVSSYILRLEGKEKSLSQQIIKR